MLIYILEAIWYDVIDNSMQVNWEAKKEVQTF